MLDASIKDRLASQSFELSPPTTPEIIKNFENHFDIKMNQFYKDIYLSFNGAYLDRDMLCIWSIENIISFYCYVDPINERRYFPIGDLMIHSDIIIACLEEEDAPIYLVDEKREIAKSANAFFDLLVNADIYK